VNNVIAEGVASSNQLSLIVGQGEGHITCPELSSEPVKWKKYSTSGELLISISFAGSIDADRDKYRIVTGSTGAKNKL